MAGVETVDPPLLSSDDTSRCPSEAACRWSDSVFVASGFESTTNKGAILAAEPAPWLRITGREPLPLAGEAVSKSGQRTGHGMGEITATCQDQWNADAGVLMLCQYVADLEAAEGDSGAPVFVEIDSERAHLYGMVWGGNEGLGRVSFSGVAALESELGWLDVESGEGDPRVDFVSPGHGESLGTGSAYEVELRVRVRDPEDGSECAGCSVDFVSSLDGALGSESVAGGEARHDARLEGEGHRVLTAEASDTGGGLSDEWILLSGGNAPPDVWIDFPELLTQIPAGVDVMFSAGSLDPDTFSALPCSSLTWETDLPGDPTYNRLHADRAL